MIKPDRYYGARYLGMKTSLWLNVDPKMEKYPNVGAYVYCFNNPVKYVDPDGKDAILISFSDYKVETGIRMTIKNPFTGKPIVNFKAPKMALGHAGVLIIDNKTGITSYYEYGRYDKEQKGIVRKVSVSNVEIGEDGKPTQESLDKVLGQISTKSGQGGKIEGTYVESDKAKEMKAYAEKVMAQNKDEKRDPYSLMSKNCATFAADVVNQDSKVDQPSITNPTPDNVVNEYQEEGNARVTYDPTTRKSNIESKD